MKKNIINLLTILLILYSSITAQTSTAPTVGDGSVGLPYEIETLNNLYWLSQNSDEWDKHFIQTGDIDAEDTKNWNGGAGFSPIGYAGTNFSGSYDGKGHTISKLYINIESSSSDVYVGLFGYVKNGTIQNVGMRNVSIISSASGFLYSGSLIGNNDGGTVNNCYNTGVISSSISSSIYSGGLIGKNDNGVVRYCYNIGTITSSGASSSSGNGGIIGWNKNGEISDCYNTGEVSSTSPSSFNMIGGIVGNNDGGSINNCYNTCSITTSGSFNSYTGGIIGRNAEGTVNTCYNTGIIFASSTTIYTTSSSASYSGGIIGYNDEGIVNDSYSSGSIISSTTTKSSQSYSGGIIGKNIKGSIGYCYNVGSICSYASSKSYTGGISASSSGTVTDCYYDIEVTGRSNQILNTTGLTTSEMKLSSSFSTWNINESSIWAIIENQTYPALKALDNAPFAFADSIKILESAADFLNNDSDYETLKENLLYRIDSVYSSNEDTTYLTIGGALEGDSLHIYYRIGEYRSEKNDTLWGNYATSIIGQNSYKASVLNISPMAEEGYSLRVAPTPTKDAGKIILTSDIHGEAVFTIYNRNETKLAIMTSDVVSSEEMTFNWSMISKLSKGIYYVEMRVNGERKAVSRIIKM